MTVQELIDKLQELDDAFKMLPVVHDVEYAWSPVDKVEVRWYDDGTLQVELT